MDYKSEYEKLKKENKELQELNNELLKNINNNCKQSKDLSILFNNSTIGMVVCSIDGRFLKVNSSFENITEYTEEELLKMTFKEITYPDDLNIDLKLLYSLLEGKNNTYQIEKRYITKSKKTIWINLSAALVRDKNNNPDVFIGTIEDITKRKEIEAAYLFNKEVYKDTALLLQSVLDGIPDIIGIQNSNHEIIKYNKAGYKFLQKSPKQVYGKKCFNLIGRKEPCDICSITNSCISKKSEKHEQYFPEFDIWFDIRTYPILDDKKEIKYVIEHLRDITSIKEIQSELKNAKESWEHIFQAIGHPVAILDENKNVIDVNNVFLSKIKKEKKKLVGKNYKKELGISQHCSERKCPFNNQNNEQEKNFEEIRIEAFNGYYLILCTPVYENDKLKYVIFIATDISYKIKAEEKFKHQENLLRQQNAEYYTVNEELLTKNKRIEEIYNRLLKANHEIKSNNTKIKSIIKNFPNGSITLLDDKLKIILTGGLEYDEYNINPEDFENKHLSELLSKKLYNANKEYLEKALRGEASHYEVKSKNNGFYINYVFPISDEKTKIKNVLLLSSNISELKNVEFELVTINEKLHNAQKEILIRNKIAESFVISEERDVFYQILNLLINEFNSQYGYFGYINDEGDLICPSLTYNVWDECKMDEKTIIFPREKWGGAWGKSLIEKTTIIKNSALNVPNGHIQLNNTIASAIIDNYSNELIGQIVFANKKGGYNEFDKIKLDNLADYIAPLLKSALREIKYKDEILEAKNKAEESDRLKSAFLANLSHEIRTPMNGILGFIDFLVKPDLNQDTKEEFIDIIKKSSKQLLTIITDIIEIAKIETNQIAINNELININQIIEEICDGFSILIPKNKEQNILFTPSLNDDNAYFETDLLKFKQIISNIIDNAIKYSENGDILIAYEIVDNYIIISIKDQGIGIEKENLEIIFKRFYKIESGLQEFRDGTGLGLSISKAYAEVLDGDIHVDSKKGSGSTFYVSLPFKHIIENIELPDKKESTIPDFSNYKVVVVDDDPFVLRYFIEVLEETNIFVQTYESIIDAIEKIKHDIDIDIILMDLKMPELNGYVAIDIIKKFNKKTPVIAQTAYALKEDIEKIQKHGFDDCITKPIDFDILINILNKYLKNDR